MDLLQTAGGLSSPPHPDAHIEGRAEKRAVRGCRLGLVALLLTVLTEGGARPERALGSSGAGTWKVFAPVPAPGSLYAPSGVAVDLQGNTYAADTGANILEKLSSTGAVLARWDGAGPRSRRFNQPHGIAIDRAGDLYVADTGNNRVVKLNQHGRVLARFRGLPGPLDVSVDRSGTLYVAAGLNVIKLSPRGKRLAVWKIPGETISDNCGPCTPTTRPVVLDAVAIAVTHQGSIWILTQGSGLRCDYHGGCETEARSRIRKLSPTGKLLGQWDINALDRSHDAAGLAVDSKGDVIVTNQLVHGNAPGAAVDIFSGEGVMLASWPSQSCGNAVHHLGGVAIDARGDISVADRTHGVVQELTPQGESMATWPACPPRLFSEPRGVAVDSAGNVYVADTGKDRIVKLSSAGEVLATWGGTGNALRQFSRPIGVAVDPAGNVIVADSGNQRVQKLSPSGEPLLGWGTNGTLAFPGLGGVAVDTEGNVYIIDQSCPGSVHKVSPDGALLATVQGGPDAILGDMCGLAAIAIDRAGNVYLMDLDNNEVFELSPSGTLLANLPINSGSEAVSTDGGIAIDDQGRVYAADEANNDVHLVSSGSSLSEGVPAGQFTAPSGIAVDADASVYVADTGNNRIQKLVVGG